ncbi:MAG: hypothetical protein AB7D06_10260 [Pedobacter sp.]
MFFAEESNLKSIGAFLRKAESSHIEDEVRAKRLSIVKELVDYIYKYPEGWDDRCTFNIKHIGDQFLNSLRNFDPSKLSGVDNIYCMAYRFLCEFDFLVGAGKELSIELRSIKNRIQVDAAQIDDDARSQIIYASYVMPANIAKDFINDSNIGIFRDFEARKSEAEKLKAEWDKELEQKKAETENLKEKLDEYKTAFNFVGLHQGFSNLSTIKYSESRRLFWSLIAMGVVVLIPLAVELYCTTNGLFAGKTLSTENLITLIPLISVEVVLIYFFRVILLNHRTVGAQKIQIELRKTLCQFIQSYADYASKIKSKDNQSLEKFENLIFSGILSDPEKLPSTFDGLDQIGELVRKVKNS